MGKIKTIELKIPNLGEAEETEVIELSAKKGDIVSVNDPLIVLESEKAAMEVPADVGGKLLEIKVKEGQNVSEGMIFAVIETEETNKVQTTEKSTQEEKPEINEERQAAKKDIEVLFDLSNADMLSMTIVSSPITIESVNFANSLSVKLFVSDTTQIEYLYQIKQYLALKSHRQ